MLTTLAATDSTGRIHVRDRMGRYLNKRGLGQDPSFVTSHYSLPSRNAHRRRLPTGILDCSVLVITTVIRQI